MTMPDDLILVRHGQSEGNVAARAEENGDLSRFTEEYVTTPGHRWPLTRVGIAQAQVVGAWLRSEFVAGQGPDGTDRPFDRHDTSPFVRTRKTAKNIDLFLYPVGATRDQYGDLYSPSAVERWWLNRDLRERDWGDIGSISRAEFESRPEYELAVRNLRVNPLYAAPPGGESIANVAANRFRNYCDTLQREATGMRVLSVTHGEFKMAARLNLERLCDERFEQIKAILERIPNCGVLHYSIKGPEKTVEKQYLQWMRRAAPVYTGTGPQEDPLNWTMQVGEWERIVFHTYSANDL